VVAKAHSLMAWGGVGSQSSDAVVACLEAVEVRAVRSFLERWL
jgi:hypothetical protein